MMHPSEPPDPNRLAELAETVGVAAGRSLERDTGAAVEVAGTKSSSTDLVTETDRAVEEAIISALLTARPDDGILAEESGIREARSPVTWVIDPIDGTTNFYYGYPGFNVSIAATIDGRVVAGVVVDPSRAETFRATRGGGATCNGRPLHAHSPDDLAHALVGTGFSYVPERRRDQARVVTSVIDRIRDIRRSGAAAIDLCHVAAGRLDAFFESGLKPWDLAAGGLIAAEAGCRIAGLHGAPADERLAIVATPAIFDELHAALAASDRVGLAVEDPSARPSARLALKFGRLES